MRNPLLVSAPAAALLVCACGSSVTTGTGGNASAGGGEGASGASGVSSASATTGEVGSSSASGMPTTGTGGVGGATLCQQACDHIGMLACGDPADCAEECADAHAQYPRCASQLDELSKCLAFVQSCDFGAECGQQLDAYWACQEANGCGTPECVGSGTSSGQTSCTCFAVCGGVDVTADCTSTNGLQATCQCLVGGMTAGSCTQPASRSCDLGLGCCGQFF